jgi:hypothetical protein
MDNPLLLNQILLKFEDGFKQHREDISAVLLTPDKSDKYLWLGSDETATIERLSFVDAQTFDNHKRFHVQDFIELPEPEDQEIDIEGIAYSDYYLWFVGSHSWKRKKPKSDKTDLENIARLSQIKTEANRYILGRIPMIAGELVKTWQHPDDPNVQLSAAKLELTKGGNLLTDALGKDAHLGCFVNATIPGKDNGFDIEGIAIYQNRLFLGLRGPVLRGWAIMLEIELETSTPELLKLKQIGQEQLYKKHFIHLNGLGIRDLCLDGEDILILAGPTMDLDGPVRIYRLQNGVNLREDTLSKPDMIQEIPYGNLDDHAEGITLFHEITGMPSLLVVYDSPAKQRLKGDGDVVVDVFKLG